MPEDNAHHLKIDISLVTMSKVAGFILGLWFIYIIRDILLLIFVAILLATAFDPFVSFLHKKKIPRSVGILILFFLAIIVVASAVYLLIPPFLEQIGQISNVFPVYWQKLSDSFLNLQQNSQTQGIATNIQKALESIRFSIGQSAQGIFPLLSNIFGSILSFIIIVVLTFYFLAQEGAIRRGFRIITPERYRPYLYDLITRMQQRLVQWLQGELLLALIIGSLVMIGLIILDVKFFLVLALVAALLELIPYIGPTIAAVPAIFFGLMDSPWKGLAVLIFYWLIQQLENHLIVPKVMSKTIGLNPLVVIIVIMVGAKLAGFLGVMLAVPTAAALSVLAKDFFESSDFNKLTQTKE